MAPSGQGWPALRSGEVQRPIASWTSAARRSRFARAAPAPMPTAMAVPVSTVPRLTSRTSIETRKVTTETAIAPSTVPKASRSSRFRATPLRYVMPNPATTQPTSRIAAPPSSQPKRTRRIPTLRPSQTTGRPSVGTTTEPAVPSAIRGPLTPAPELRLRCRELGIAVNQPHLRTPEGRARTGIVGGYGDRERGPQRIEVEEERDRQAEVRDQQL